MNIAQRPQPGLSARIAIGGVRAYQVALSPIFAMLGSACIFQPSCSEYMADAVRERGLARGVFAGTWRLLRCNPFNRGGYDPVRPR